MSFARLNKEGVIRSEAPNDDIFYTVPDVDQNVTILDVGYGTRLLSGWLDLNFQASDKKIQYQGGEKDLWSLGATWTYRF